MFVFRSVSPAWVSPTIGLTINVTNRNYRKRSGISVAKGMTNS